MFSFDEEVSYEQGLCIRDDCAALAPLWKEFEIDDLRHMKERVFVRI